jgi:sugar/nucleoside kinase (ribokinase family)
MLLGHFAVDRIVVDGASHVASGGGVYFGSVALRRQGLDVAIVTRLRDSDFHRLDEVEREGVRVYATSAPQTSGIENVYQSADMERRVCRPLGFAGAIQPAEIPDLSVTLYAVVPIMAGEVELPLVRMLARRGPVALDIQGFVRVREGDSLVFRPWADLEEGLGHITYLKVDRAEAEFLTGESDLEAAARRLAALGPSEVVVTESSGVLVFAGGQFFRAPFRSRSLAGRTGRGDTCFSTYLGRRLSASPGEAVRLAAAVTSLKQETPGPWQGSLAEAEALAGDRV